MTLNKLVDFDQPLPNFEKRIKERVDKDLRMISFSMYGDPNEPSFSAVWDERPQDLHPLKFTLGKSLTDFIKICNDNKAAKFHPVFVSATGGETNARFSAIFEKSVRPGGTLPEMSIHKSLADFGAEVESRARNAWIIHNATIYDDVKSGARVTAIWRKNTKNTAWMAHAGLSESDHKKYFKAGIGWVGALGIHHSLQSASLPRDLPR